MQLQGKIIQSLPLQSGTSKSGNAWKKQEHILEIPGQYAKKVCFNLFGDNVDKFPIQVGLDVTLDVDVESREWQGRWYTEVRAWNVTYTQTAQVAPTATAYAKPVAQPIAPAPGYPYAQPQAQTAPAPQPQPVAAGDLPF